MLKSPCKCVSFLEFDPVVATFDPTLYSCCFRYLDAVGYVTKPVLCLTLSRGGRADSDFGAVKGEHTKLSSRINTKSRTNVIRMAGSVTKGN